MASYKGIEFAKGYKKPFADFVKEFGSLYIFNEMHPKIREKELVKAHKIATDGDLSSTTSENKKTTAK